MSQARCDLPRYWHSIAWFVRGCRSTATRKDKEACGQLGVAACRPRVLARRAPYGLRNRRRWRTHVRLADSARGGGSVTLRRSSAHRRHTPSEAERDIPRDSRLLASACRARMLSKKMRRVSSEANCKHSDSSTPHCDLRHMRARRGKSSSPTLSTMPSGNMPLPSASTVKMSVTSRIGMVTAKVSSMMRTYCMSSPTWRVTDRWSTGISRTCLTTITGTPRLAMLRKLLRVSDKRVFRGRLACHPPLSGSESSCSAVSCDLR
mmetsp:Transcript_113455/g.315565  ORF Transcript_113455/g.315565 Transcript_113455/m.315565 type:complete len:263 (+) Transcript_113455:23-811(+)